MLELLATVIRFGRLREHLDDDGRVGELVLGIVGAGALLLFIPYLGHEGGELSRRGRVFYAPWSTFLPGGANFAGWLGALLTVVTNLAFALLAASEAEFGLLLMTVSADNLAGGIAGSVFIAYLSSLTNTAYTATQYALFSSMFTLAGKFLGGFSGVVVDATSYVHFFIITGLLGIPAILLVLFPGCLWLLLYHL